MYICRPAFLLAMVMALLGTVLAGLGNWSAVAYYGVGLVSILAYFAVFTWVDGR